MAFNCSQEIPAGQQAQTVRSRHCTLAVSVALPLNVNVQVFVLLPPLEQAPDQIASRPFDTVNVIAVPVANDADPVLPTVTLMPVGFDVIRSPLRPVAVTVSDAPCDGGVTVRAAARVVPPPVPVMVTDVDAVTAVVLTANVARLLPAATVIDAGTVAVLGALLESVTTSPPLGAALVRVAVPWETLPPTTLVGLRVIADSVGAEGGACKVKRRTDENGPATPDELIAWTRHQYCRDGSVGAVNCDAVTV
ncbi:MAG: hypothetical protein QOJ08_1688 [Ilumatobacteraceae bacterium]